MYGAQHVSPIVGLYIHRPLRRQPRLINASYVAGAMACATAPSDTLPLEDDGEDEAQYPHEVLDRP